MQGYKVAKCASRTLWRGARCPSLSSIVVILVGAEPIPQARHLCRPFDPPGILDGRQREYAGARVDHCFLGPDGRQGRQGGRSQVEHRSLGRLVGFGTQEVQSALAFLMDMDIALTEGRRLAALEQAVPHHLQEGQVHTGTDRGLVSVP